MTHTTLAGVVLALGWSTFALSAADDALEPVLSSCDPTSDALGSDATLAHHAGRYQLMLVRRIDAVDIDSVRGTVVLYPQVPGLEALGDASTPLYGTTDIDLEAVAARRVGDTASDAADAPGVLVLELERTGTRNILLRLGSAANRRNGMLYDSAYTVLEVHEISDDGFRGSWRSGAESFRTGGYFCATRVP